MCRWLLSIVMVAMVAAVTADDPIAVYPPVQETSASATVPYPYAQAQKDSYAADELAQAVGYQAAPVGYFPFGLAAIKAVSEAESAAVVIKAILWVVSHVAAVLIGSFVALGVCKLTPVCSYVAHRWYRSEVPSKEEVRSLAKPAMSMLKAALAKYGSNSL